MCNIKVYGRTILFCVHVSLLSEMDTWTPKEDVKIGLFSICTKTKKTSEKIFYVPIDFTLGGDGKVQLDNPRHPCNMPPRSHLQLFRNSFSHEFIFCCLFLLNFWREKRWGMIVEMCFKVQGEKVAADGIYWTKIEESSLDIWILKKLNFGS